VIDIGGIMSHAAIVCREYSLPAVSFSLPLHKHKGAAKQPGARLTG
jgi:hypothetical protein